MYYISAKNVNEQIKATFFFHENFMFQKRTDETIVLDKRLLAITVVLPKAPVNSPCWWAGVLPHN